jgi:hypothetical protein
MREATIAIEGVGKVGAPPKTHEKQRRESMKRKGMLHDTWGECAMDKAKWREMIKGKSILHSHPSSMDVLRRHPERAVGAKVERQCE